MKADKIKDIMNKHYQGIEVPGDLETRLSSTIDRLAAEEAHSDGARPARRVTLWKAVAVAASVTVIITLALSLPVRDSNLQIADTFTNARDAYQETEEVLQYVSSLMNKGVNKVSETHKTISAINTVNKYIEIK
ncbi:MAG TPA: hypothetical protein DDW70_05145 [Rikenellaceae bacterium]|jgi:hypothetical protein|nr:hypothetical protein [Bacteroidales bacterium]HBG53578.1 hypothetical protein [Rikenellaceae bacterium]